MDRPAPNRRSESSIIAPPRSVPLLAFCVSGVRSATFANLPETWPFSLDFEPFLVNFSLKPAIRESCHFAVKKIWVWARSTGDQS
jgi:hypothetical protein